MLIGDGGQRLTFGTLQWANILLSCKSCLLYGQYDGRRDAMWKNPKQKNFTSVYFLKSIPLTAWSD